MRNLIENAEVHHLLGYQAAGTGTDNSTGMDMKGFDQAVFLVDFGAITAGSDVDIHVEMSADNITYVDAYDENGNQITKAIADTDDNKVCKLEVNNPNPDYPYLRMVIVIATQNAVTNAVIGLARRAKKGKVAAESDAVNGGVWNGTYTS